MALGTGIEIPNNFDLNSPLPLDSRYKAATIAARDAIPLVARFMGLQVAVDDGGDGNQKLFWLVGGIANENWAEFQSGSDGGLKTVPDKDARLAIPEVEKYDGMLVKQVDTGVIWAWNSPPAVSPDIPKWTTSNNQSVMTLLPVDGAEDGGDLSKAIVAYENTALVFPIDNIVLGASPFGPGPHEVGTILTVVNMSDFIIEIPSGDGSYKFLGSTINLSQRGESATFKLLNTFWILIGRSN